MIFFLEQLSEINIIFIFLMVLFSFISNYFVAYRWNILVDYVDENNNHKKGFYFFYSALSTFVSGFSIQTLGNFGVKVLSLKYKKNIDFIRSSNTVFAESIIGFLIIIIMFIPSLFYILKLCNAFSSILFQITVILIIYYLWIKYEFIIVNTVFFFCRIMKKISVTLKFNLKMIDVANDNKNIVLSRKLFIISLAVYFSMLIRYYIFLKALNIEVDFLGFILLFPAVYLISALGFTPGSLGLSEAGWLGALIFLGVKYEDASIYMVAQRMFNLVLSAVILFIAYILYIAKDNYFIKQRNQS